MSEPAGKGEGSGELINKSGSTAVLTEVGQAEAARESLRRPLRAAEVISATAARQRLEYSLEAHRPEMGRFFLAHFLGFQFEYTADSCIICFDVQDFMCNPKGTLHGGVIATALDTSMGHLVAHLHGPASTVEMKVQYLCAVEPGPCEVKATVLKRGKRLWFLEGSLYSGEAQRAAFATATWSA